nr:clavesin-1-like isoform X1 [Leptinotarsa decemlineata]
MIIVVAENDLLKSIETRAGYLERFLYGTNFSVEESFKKIKAFQELQMEHPEWCTREAPIEKKSIIEMDIRMLLDDYDKDGRPIYLVKMGNLDVSKMSMYDVVAIDDIWLESILSKNPRITKNGLCVLLDMEKCSWKLMKWLSPENIKIGVRRTEALPFSELKVHLVNNSFFVNTIVRMVWPFLSERIKNMVIFHPNDWNSLYKYIDQEVLPTEYGGAKNINYTELYKKLFQRNDEIFRSFQSYRKTETL